LSESLSTPIPEPEPIAPLEPEATLEPEPAPEAPPLPRSHVQTAGFDAAAAVAPDLNLKQGAVGAFDASTTCAEPRPGTDRTGVTAAGFEATRASPSRSAGGAVNTSGFGRSAPAKASIVQKVKTGGFDDDAAAAKAKAATARAKPVVTPVEVLFKPTPAYTDEARTLKIEGDILLEVEFEATNRVRVVRVVRGLGHGLDEMAIRGEKPVDFRASVTIVFRLT